jgi:hypothetical protein
MLLVSPNVTFAPIENAFPTVRADAESLETATLAEFRVNVPTPSPASLPIRKTLPDPPVTVTPPVKVLAPLKVNTPTPAFVSKNPPPIGPLNTTT